MCRRRRYTWWCIMSDSKYPHADRWREAFTSGRAKEIKDFLEWMTGGDFSPHQDGVDESPCLKLGRVIDEKWSSDMFPVSRGEEDAMFNAVRASAVVGLLIRSHDSDVDRERMIMRFFGVDPDALECERRAMLDELQNDRAITQGD